jgi:prepilin-type N-terminal cleavage/methylation domain-containing protein
MLRRRGFTMIELLVVISVIVLLAGLLLPVISLVRRLANDVKCGSQLQQIAAAVEVYKGDNDGAFPEKLNDSDPNSTADLFHRNGPLKGLQKILICPFDPKHGQDPFMGRAPPPTWDDLSLIKEPNSSYDYETSREYLIQKYIDGFFQDIPVGQRPGLNTSGATWVAGKHHQLQFGNLKSDGSGTYGESFSGSQFPIIRCYWHYRWTGASSEDTTKKVKNVAWDLNVFNSTPFWEHDANPAIPIH